MIVKAVGLLSFLMLLGALSRILTVPEIPKLITSFTGTVAHLFTGTING